MVARLVTKIEVSKTGKRTVYHERAEPNKLGWAGTHPDTPKLRKECSACTKGTLDSVRNAPR